MIRFGLAFAVLAMSIFGTSAIASDSSTTELDLTSIGAVDRNIRVYRQTPCSYWRYNSDVSGNICTFTDRRIEVADANDLATVLREMLAKIDSLEKRVQELENESH